MGLFKSKQERRIERTIQVRQSLGVIRRNIQENEKWEAGYIEKAKVARKLGDTNQYEFLKKAVRKTATIKKSLERQMLALETAIQMKEQAEGQHDFATAMNAISKSIAEVFGATDLTRTQVNFERALAQASTMEERIDTFLSMTSESMFDAQNGAANELVSDADVERMLSSEVEREESAEIQEIERDIAGIEKEIGKLQK